MQVFLKCNGESGHEQKKCQYKGPALRDMTILGIVPLQNRKIILKWLRRLIYSLDFNKNYIFGKLLPRNFE